VSDKEWRNLLGLWIRFIVSAAVIVLLAGFIEKYDQVIVPQVSMAFNQWTKNKYAPEYKIELKKGLIVTGLIGVAGGTFQVLNLLLPFFAS